LQFKKLIAWARQNNKSMNSEKGSTSQANSNSPSSPSALKSLTIDSLSPPNDNPSSSQDPSVIFSNGNPSSSPLSSNSIFTNPNLSPSSSQNSNLNSKTQTNSQGKTNK
jgi:hypothetical protein